MWSADIGLSALLKYLGSFIKPFRQKPAMCEAYHFYINIGLAPFSKICVICFIKSDKNDKKCFLLHFFVLKIFKFLSWPFGHVKKTDLIRKIRLISNFMTLQPGLKTVAIHILPNISWIKSDQTMKLGQLIEYNKINIFIQKLCKKLGSETSSRPLFILKKCLIWGKSKWFAA